MVTLEIVERVREVAAQGEWARTSEPHEQGLVLWSVAADRDHRHRSIAEQIVAAASLPHQLRILDAREYGASTNLITPARTQEEADAPKKANVSSYVALKFQTA